MNEKHKPMEHHTATPMRSMHMTTPMATTAPAQITAMNTVVNTMSTIIMTMNMGTATRTMILCLLSVLFWMETSTQISSMAGWRSY